MYNYAAKILLFLPISKFLILRIVFSARSNTIVEASPYRLRSGNVPLGELGGSLVLAQCSFSRFAPSGQIRLQRAVIARCALARLALIFF